MVLTVTIWRPNLKNRRDLRNIFSQPKQQVQLIFFVVICWTSLLSLSLVIFLRTSRDSLINFGAASNISPDFLMVVGNTFSITIWTLLMFIGVLGLLLLFWLFVISHRVFGPAVQIKKVISDLRAGNYSVRGQLRKNDAFHDVMDDLNLLAEELARKNRG